MIIRRVLQGLVPAVVVLSACGSGEGGGSSEPTPDRKTALEKAYAKCVELARPTSGEKDSIRVTELMDVGDDGRTLSVASNEEGGDISTIRTYFAVTCVLGQTGAPESIMSEMQSTNALMGRQSAEWDGFKMSYSYHGDSGFSAVITET